MPFARRVLSCLSLRVLPSSPRNYNALYRTISRRPLRCIRAASCGVLLVCPCGVHLYALHRGNVAAACGVLAVYIRGGLAFFSRPKRRTSGEWQRLYILLYPLRTNILYILVRNGIYKICAFAICLQTDVSHANRRHGAACMLEGVHLAACGVLRRCALPGRIHPPRRGTPPVGAPGQGTPPFSEIFFLFFLKRGRKHK